MKKMSRIMLWLGVLSLALAANAWAQPAGPGAGKGAMRQKAGMGMYDPKTVETVSGEVTQVQTMGRRTRGVHLQVKTDKETLLVVLGPAQYLEQQKMTFAVGDKVEIKGSRIQHPQQAMLVAGEVKKGDQVLKLRDDQGKPLWSPQMPKRKIPIE
ncbi:MAG: DNA-binding protein [Deltaproteobacteria bacterium]|nr:DNA-binding protein [Deltaproteobacteria bacterium]